MDLRIEIAAVLQTVGSEFRIVQSQLRSVVRADVDRQCHWPTCAGRSGQMEVAQFIADTCRARLVAWSQHLLDMTIRRENKNNLEVNLWPEILGAAADNVAQSRGDDFAKLSVISFSRVGVAKALRLGQCLGERNVSFVLCRSLQRKQQESRKRVRPSHHINPSFCIVFRPTTRHLEESMVINFMKKRSSFISFVRLTAFL